MRTALLFLALTAAKLSAASAPDSLSGKIYHESTVIVRNVSDFTIRFDADGHYHFLKNVGGGTVTPDGSRVLVEPPDDGTYTYAHTGPATATVTLSEPGGTLARVSRFKTFDSSTTTSATLTLAFDTDSSGGAFYFTEASALQTAPVLNLSLRGTVAPGKTLIAGLVVPGDPRRFSDTHDALIRVVGPGLTPLGVDGAWSDPDFRLYFGANPAPVGAHYGDWNQTPAVAAAMQKIFATVGAFPLPSGSKDAAAVVRLSPGAYTIVCQAPADDAGGEALVEVYFLP